MKKPKTREHSRIGRKVLLVGNGINADSPGYRWEDLIRDLINEFDQERKINQGKKPFPFLYEEIVLQSKDKMLRERKIKNFIALKVRGIRNNEIHAEIARQNFETILTTNYDYNFEEAFNDKKNKSENIGGIKEKRYSLFRHSRMGRSKIWHIHGEANAPSSILLGYEQYCGYLQYMRNYVVTGTGDNYERHHVKALMQRILGGNELIISWIDHFFLSDVYILGLTMDFVEMHLWWLLTYRARIIRGGSLPIHNKILFFIPEPYVKKSKERLQLLESCGVIIKPLKYSDKNRTRYYKHALRIIKGER